MNHPISQTATYFFNSLLGFVAGATFGDSDRSTYRRVGSGLQTHPSPRYFNLLPRPLDDRIARGLYPSLFHLAFRAARKLTSRVAASRRTSDPTISPVVMPGGSLKGCELRQSAQIKERTMAELTIKDIERLAAIYSEAPEKLSGTDPKRLVDAMVRTSKKPIGTEERRLPDGYLSLREVENSLDRRMWAGFGRGELAQQVLRNAKQMNKRSIGFGARRDRVATSLQAAFFAGKLTLYVAADEPRFRERFKELPSLAKEPMPVPKELLGHVFVKGRLLGTFAIRPSRKLVRHDQLFALLNCGHLVVREGDFRRWVQSERRKRRWPSQHASDARPVGRPSKLNAQLRNAILEMAQGQGWNGDRQPISKLHRRLNDKVWICRVSTRLLG